MHDLQLFQNDQFGQVRIVERDGSPWFVAADVCAALDLTDTSKTVSYLDDDEKGTITNRTPGGAQEMLIINEPGLYSLVLRSRKPEAKAFKRWICHEVIPAIRKTGEYRANKPRRSSEDITARSAAVSYRMMARMKAYPETMRAVFAAKSVALLTGEPLSGLLPPVLDGRDRWMSPTDLGQHFGISANTIGKMLTAAGLHGRDDIDHKHSRPLAGQGLNSKKEITVYTYDPAVVLPVLEKALRGDPALM